MKGGEGQIVMRKLPGNGEWGLENVGRVEWCSGKRGKIGEYFGEGGCRDRASPCEVGLQ